MGIEDILNQTNKKDIKKLIAILQILADEDDANEVVDSEDMVEQKTVKKAISSNKKTKTSKQNNKFLDMPERNMYKEDAVLDKKLNIHPPVARSREFEPISVLCRVCGKTETVAPTLVESVSRYKCNSCAKNPG